MIKNIKMWKLSRKNDKIVAVIMYKDKLGRKLVALGTDGTPEGKAEIAKLLKDEFRTQRAYGEISGNLLGFVKKILGSELEQYLIPAEKVKEVIGQEVQIIDKFAYKRKIGGEWIEKVMYGKIKNFF